jgi:hypothetical protein
VAEVLQCRPGCSRDGRDLGTSAASQQFPTSSPAARLLDRRGPLA